jgi:NADH:ubiquinone oxidoreductase subunit F (NADH-binding)
MLYNPSMDGQAAGVAAMDPVSLGRTGAHPRSRPLIIRGEQLEREDHAGYTRDGGYSGSLAGAALLTAVEAAGLRGRGGAAFPAARKWRSVLEREGPRVVLANGGETEPLSIKDRYLLCLRPHLVLDGLLLAADAMDAQAAYIYVTDPEIFDSVERAIHELGPTPVPIQLTRAEGRYVAAEETSAIQSIAGLPAKPTAKPPRPFEVGVGGLPTLVHNVETLAHVAAIARYGPAAFRDAGTEGSPGSFLLTASGACNRPGLYEVPLGIGLGDAIDAVAEGTVGTPRGFLLGGFFGGFVAGHCAAVALDYDALRERDNGLGCGAVHVLGHDDCPVAVAAAVMAFLAGESSGQCGACVNGTAGMRDVLASLARSEATSDDVARLARWSQTLVRRGACGLLDGAALLARSLLREFPDTIAEHLSGACPMCGHASPHHHATSSEGAPCA